MPSLSRSRSVNSERTSISMRSSPKRSLYSDMPSDANHFAIVDTGYLLANKLDAVLDGSIQGALAFRSDPSW